MVTHTHTHTERLHTCANTSHNPQAHTHTHTHTHTHENCVLGMGMRDSLPRDVCELIIEVLSPKIFPNLVQECMSVHNQDVELALSSFPCSIVYCCYIIIVLHMRTCLIISLVLNLTRDA